jgi:putative DNA primase/helicase
MTREASMQASDLINAGLALIPIPYGEKGPKHKDWNQRSQTITSPEQAYLLTNKNIGLAHAYCTPTPTCALDLDDAKKAYRFLLKHGINLKTLFGDPNAVAIWSGKPNSLKLLFRLPENTEPLETKVIKSDDNKTVLELRCASKDGRTLQDVLPPSLHPLGTQYKWIGDGDPRFIPIIPPELLTLWLTFAAETGNEKSPNRTSPAGTYSSPETPREIATLISALQYLTADRDYESWRDIVWAILSTRWSCSEEIARKWSESAPNRFNEASFNTVVNSYREDHPKPITVGTIYFLAKLRGWNV